MRRRFDVFWDPLFRKYKEKQELEKHLASLELTSYRIKKAKINTLLLLFGLNQDLEDRKGNIIANRDPTLNIPKYRSRFVNNLFACFVNMVHLHRGLLKRIPIPNTLFHGTTTAFLTNTMKEGLTPSKAGQCWIEDKCKKLRKVCLTDSLYAAEYFALVAAEEVGGEAVVLKVNVKGIQNKMHITAETLSSDGSTVFDTYFEFYFTEPILPDRIKVWYVLPKPSAYQLLTYLVYCSNLSESSKEEEHCRLETNLVVKT